MLELPNALNAWGTTDFNETLKRELEQLDIDQLPLQQGLSTKKMGSGLALTHRPLPPLSLTLAW